MNDSQRPLAPATPPAEPAPYAPSALARRSWRDRLRRRLPSGRGAVAAGAVLAGLAIGGAGFGAGYAVGDDGSADTATTQTGSGWDRGQPDDGRGPMGDLDGQVPGGGVGGPPGDLTQGGATDQAPDLDGDGQPDADSDTDSGSTSGSATTSGSAALNS